MRGIILSLEVLPFVSKGTLSYMLQDTELQDQRITAVREAEAEAVAPVVGEESSEWLCLEENGVK